MKKRFVLFAVAVVVSLAGATPAGAEPVYGRVTMTVHTHSGPGLLFPVDRLPFDFEAGDTFAYSSRLCADRAPFNDIGLNFVPDYPGVDDVTGTARVRHLAEGTIVADYGNRGLVEGTITTVLCVRDASGAWVPSEHSIVSHYRAQYVFAAPNDLHLYGSFRFSPTESTGTFEDLQGGGRFEARLTCLGEASCAPIGEFTDFVASTGDPTLPAGQLQPGMSGTYYDPTVEPVP